MAEFQTEIRIVGMKAILVVVADDFCPEVAPSIRCNLAVLFSFILNPIKS
jgi:multisubunit Na+/H+ antiporter MnhG subunit